MILVISALLSSQDCAQQLTSALDEPIQVCASLIDAIEKLQSCEFSAVIFDQLLLDANPEAGDAALKLLGSAAPVYLSFAVSGPSRLLREVKSAMARRDRESLAARMEGQRSLRHELRNTATALLLSCEEALQAPQLPESALNKMQVVRNLAQEMTGKLEETAS